VTIESIEEVVIGQKPVNSGATMAVFAAGTTGGVYPVRRKDNGSTGATAAGVIAGVESPPPQADRTAAAPNVKPTKE
jgi:hypothetical protein